MSEELKEKLRQAYDKKAAVRDARSPQAWKVTLRNRFLATLQKADAKSMLEIGAATGIDGLFFQQNGFEVTGIDLSPEQIALCRKKGLKAEVMDVTKLHFAPDSFDAAYSFNCLLHLPKADMPTALQQIRRVLKPNGLFCLGLYGGYDFEGIFKDDDHDPKRFYAYYSDEALQTVLNAHFDLLDFQSISVPDADDLHFQACALQKKDIQS